MEQLGHMEYGSENELVPTIVFVDDYALSSVGGGERHLLAVAEACLKWGYRVCLLCESGSGLEREGRALGLEVHPLRIHTRWFPAAYARLVRKIREIGPDIVHAHGFYVSALGRRAAKSAGVPHVLTTVHSMPTATLQLKHGLRAVFEQRAREWIWRRTQRYGDVFVAVVAAVGVELEEIGVPGEKIVTIRNGIAPAVTKTDTPAVRTYNRLVVGSVGRFEPLKGFIYLVRAAALVIEQYGTDVEFRLVGDGSLRGELEAEACALGLGDHFRFLGWSNHALEEMHEMDVYVAPSVTDTTNLTVLEAMALGKPVVASAVGGIPETVADGESGLLVEPRRPDRLADEIIRLLRSSELREMLGEAGRARFEEYFTMEHMLDAHRALYESLLEQGSAGAGHT